MNDIPDRDAPQTREVHIHLVSDSTGETVHGLARACIVQFENIEAEEHNWPLVRTSAQMEKVLAGIKERPGIVMYTIVNEQLRQKLQAGCRKLRIPCISILDPIINTLANYLGVESRGQPGRQHALDAEYFSRIDAMQFALAHDDGQQIWNIHNSDVILTGVSRTSKTPTCIYLANRGIKAANVPFVHGVPLPDELLMLGKPPGPLVVGLTKDPAQLVQIRRNRLRMIAEASETDYVDIETVTEEVNACRRICNEHKWHVLDVSRRSIEETAAAIMQLYEKRLGQMND